MKVFERDGKINFVDHRNVFVGFDNSQQCCEDFGWFTSRTAPIPTPGSLDTDALVKGRLSDLELEPFFFDTSFMLIQQDLVTFRLVTSPAWDRLLPEEECFLTLFNHHDGYYGHGFECQESFPLEKGYI